MMCLQEKEMKSVRFYDLVVDIFDAVLAKTGEDIDSYSYLEI